MNSTLLQILRVGSLPALVALLFAWFGWSVAAWLGLTGARLWAIRSAIWLLGAVAAVLLALIMRNRERRRPRGDTQIDEALAQARAALAGRGRSGKVADHPVIFVAGPTDGAKTTSIVQSGLHPELLAGRVWRGEEVAPTSGVNVWLASDTLWIEAGGELIEEEGRWARLADRLRPARLRAALAGGRQPPRAVVVCYSCGSFLRPGAADATVADAKRLRERLVHLADRLGVRLPVYVVFTKADRIPHFIEFVRGMSEEEATQVLGATLPLAGGGDPGTHQEREGARIHHAFSGLVHNLALRRIDHIALEAPEEVRGGAYEFPRELGKLADGMTRFLVELLRPAQLGGRPFLRGFYLTGVRPLIVADAGAAHPTPTPLRSDATSVFDLSSISAVPAAEPSGGVRRIPQWAFLRGVLGTVVLRDETAQAVTAGGSRVDGVRRGLLAVGVALLAFFSVGMIASFFGNRALLQDAAVALDGARVVGESGIHPLPDDELVALDRLREPVALLRGHMEEGRPRRLGFGLYTGSRAHPHLRAAFFSRFDRGLWARTHSDLEATLAGLGTADAGAVGYGDAYDWLKAYLITSDHERYSTAEFLTPALLPIWTGVREMAPESSDIAARQFDLFAMELPHGNPYPGSADPGRVALAREFLGRFAEADHFYQALLAGAATDGIQPVEFHRLHPGADVSVRSALVVPAAFTREGWDHVQATLADVDRLFARESWVLGDRSVAPADRERLARDLALRYEEDYVETWARFLGDARVIAFQGVPDAARKLGSLSGNQSPILQLLATASGHTAVDTGRVARAFQPVHIVTPPDITDRYISDGNQSWVQGMVGIHAALERAAAAQGPARTQALTDATGAVDQTRMQLRQIAQGFNVDAEALPVAQAVERLMMAPIEDAERLARAGPAAEANAGAAAFCQAYNPMAGVYPFNVRGSSEATLDQVVAILHPTASQLSAFEGETLQGLVIPQGTGFGAAPGAAIRPSDAFLRFYSRARQMSRALFNPDGSGPSVVFTLRPQATDAAPEIFVTVDGQRQEVTRVSQASRTFVWEGARAGEATIEAVVQGNRVTLFAGTGTWGVFRLFHRGRWETISPNLHLVTWDFTQPRVSVTAEVSFERGIPIFDPSFLDGLACVPRIAN